LFERFIDTICTGICDNDNGERFTRQFWFMNFFLCDYWKMFRHNKYNFFQKRSHFSLFFQVWPRTSFCYVVFLQHKSSTFFDRIRIEVSQLKIKMKCFSMYFKS
jgi:hypothetical protein